MWGLHVPPLTNGGRRWEGEREAGVGRGEYTTAWTERTVWTCQRGVYFLLVLPFHNVLFSLVLKQFFCFFILILAIYALLFSGSIVRFFFHSSHNV